MSRASKRIVGNISVLTALVALVAVLVFAATSPTFLKNDAKLTAEANAGTPIVQAMATPTPTPSKTPVPNKIVDPAQAWADDMMNLLLNGNSKSTFDDFNKDLPHHYIESWGSESEGVLYITVSGDDWKSAELDNLGNTVMFTAGNETPGLLEVNVSSDSDVTGHADRDNLQDF
ncbi:hypothetical protein ACT3TP_03055 [Glutamicibacter sp. AOP38-B1-38]|uniref:hypothetical protein n=1 Tax=Glutamicibacter sp. AOP38-B1-38 TaxID=3457680 RepID=UPI004034935B